MLINMNGLNYSSVSKLAYGTLLIIIIIITGWYVVPRVVDKFYQGGFDQSKIDAIRKSMEQKQDNQKYEDLLTEVEAGNPNMDEALMLKKTKDILKNSKSSFSDAEKKTILNNLNKK